MSKASVFQPGRILEVLVRHDIRFVVIGGIAAQAHGSTSATRDLDVCYSCDPNNLCAIVEALADLQAIRRDLPSGVTVPPVDIRTLRLGDLFLFETESGPLDLLASPDPGLDYEQLARTAVPFEIEGRRVLVASVDDLIRMKRAAGRPKDRIELEVLGALREELDRQA